MKFQKTANLFDTTFDDKHLLLKNGLKFMINLMKNILTLTK